MVKRMACRQIETTQYIVSVRARTFTLYLGFVLVISRDGVNSREHHQPPLRNLTPYMSVGTLNLSTIARDGEKDKKEKVVQGVPGPT